MSNSSVTNNDVDTQNVSSDSSRVTGCVKWFNNKAGYGFITVSSGPHAGDVFVHHSAVSVGEEQYRFLVQGEYVEFECISVENGPHQWQAANVTGLHSGRLMCETRRAVRSTRPPQPSDTPEQVSSRPQYRQPRESRQPSDSREPRVSVTQDQRPRSRRPLVAEQATGVDGDGYEWLLVRKYPRNEQSGPRGVRPQRVERSASGLPPPRRVRSVVHTSESN